VVRKIVAAVVVFLCIAGTASHAAATPPPTKVTTAGDYVRLKVKSGTNADWGGVLCSGFVFKPVSPVGTTARNQIPTTNNPTSSGPVVVTLRPPIATGCSFSSGATVTASGVWKLLLQHRTSGNVATIKVPKGGLIADSEFGGASCRATFSPTAETSLVGTWTNGTPSRVTIVDAPIDDLVTGTGCPTGIHDTFVSFTLIATDVSNAASVITVS